MVFFVRLQTNSPELVLCSSLRMGQFRCNDTLNIDPATQQLRGCTKDNVAKSKLIIMRSFIYGVDNNKGQRDKVAGDVILFCNFDSSL
jgi:hypothetical protein